MASTDLSPSADLIRRFHSYELMPLAEQLCKQGCTLFPGGKSPDCRSFYVDRKKTSMEKADFEVFGPGSVEDFEQALVQLWTQQGLPQLARLAPSLAKIARAVYFTEDRDEEVSPFMYVMF